MPEAAPERSRMMGGFVLSFFKELEMPPFFSKETKKVYVRNDGRLGQGRTSPCENACPLGNPIQKMEKAIAEGDAARALYILRAVNPFPGVTGRVCPHPCEEVCNRKCYDEALSIRALERHASDAGFSRLRRLNPLPATGRKIAVVGAGPAGMACAYISALLGHEVTVFEASPVAGGVPRQSIPDFRLPKDVVDREVGVILDLGVRILTNTEVGRDISLDELRARYDACLLAVGNRKERMLSIPGIEHALPAVSFLKNSNLHRESLEGKKVVILGGGGVAFDSAFTALRLGAAQTSLICLEDRACMRVPAAEVAQADDEDVALHTGYLAASIESENGRVRAVTADAVSSFRFDEAGRLHAEFLPDGKLRVEADVVICASGLMADLSLLDGGECAQMERTPRGGVKTRFAASSVPGIFAAGECSSGPSLVSAAIAEGRQAAFEMHAWLTGKEAGCAVDAWLDEEDRLCLQYLEHKGTQHEVAFEEIVNITHHEKAVRRSTCLHTAKDTWLAFEELDKGFSEEDAREEAARCLHCGHCQECGECVASCPGLILKPGDGSPAVAYPDECWHCGCCRLACPGACISFKFPLHTFL